MNIFEGKQGVLPGFRSQGQSIGVRKMELAQPVIRRCGEVGLLMAVLLFVSWLVFQDYPQILISALLNGLSGAAAMVFPRFLNRGQARLGILVFLTSAMVGLQALALSASALMGVWSIGWVSLILTGLMLLEENDRRWFSGLSLALLIANLAMAATAGANAATFAQANASAFAQANAPLLAGWFRPLNASASLAVLLICGAALLAAWVMNIRVALREHEKWLQQAGRTGPAAAPQEVVPPAVADVPPAVADAPQEAVPPAVADAPQEAVPPAVADVPPAAAEAPEGGVTKDLEDLVARIKEVSATLDAAASEILAATHQQVAGANQQAAAVAQSYAAVEEVRAVTRMLLSLAQQVATAAQETAAIAHAGRQAMAATITGMNETQSKYEWIQETITSLGKKSAQISQIITSVGEIANQSNLLALNASIEAALAGDAGRGFTVIAREMRKLAEESRSATVQVKDILMEIKNATVRSVMVAQDGVESVVQSIQQAEQAQATIDRLAETIDRSARLSAQMAEGGRQQLDGMEQLTLAFNSINRFVDQALASARQTEQAAQGLSAAAHALSEEIEEG